MSLWLWGRKLSLKQNTENSNYQRNELIPQHKNGWLFIKKNT